ncbi:MAG: LytTR family transcriptional regulator DNA-binding domain-containing protein [Thomasclavelia ramosa]
MLYLLYENKKSICIRDTIGNIEKSHLSNGLVRINRSTIINMLHIKDIKKNKICLKNNIELIISLGYNKHFEKHYQSYIWGLL